MTKDSGRKCSSCGNNGHNSRTCKCHSEKQQMGVKLFGVTIMKKEEESMKKSLSMGNLLHAHNHLDDDRGYLSDGGPKRRDSHERKRGVPWTEEEHETFLKGLEKLGKGDWRGISRRFVTTKTPTQVASHAQKYFLRQKAATSSSAIKKKRRTSLFDLRRKSNNHHSPLSNLNPTKQLTEQMAALATTATPRPSMENSIWPKPAASRASVEASLWPKPAPTYAITPHANIPHMVGGSAGRSNYVGLSMVPTMNYANSGYFYASQSTEKLAVGPPHAAASASFSLASPQPKFKAQSEQLGNSSSLVNTDLKLGIGGRSPMPKDRNKFSSETSNLISVV
ncbi:hypothetical protein MKW98_021564 [Papaver atlanticum]|uniref:MYB transcription factor n=1 Tax=Papaver atlanticum TaxID=357466 RepID=A0AAD4TCC7_9MAGN|nr:hypothetical protein MKW98_021564 [Papaver atlanticum]